MTPSREAAGATRTCPHCKATILESSAVCPACHHHLRVGAKRTAGPPRLTVHPFTVEGRVRGGGDDAGWEYSVIVCVRNDRGDELGRHVVGVGALRRDEGRSFTLDVEVYVPV